MAKAIMKVVPTPKYTITLELSQAEAETILVICHNISGSPENSPRRHTANIEKALRTVGVKQEIGFINSGTIHFEDYCTDSPFFG